MKISAGTIARTITLCLALVNQVLMVMGKNTISFADNDIYQIVSMAFTVITAVLSWWHNNSFTTAAIAADEVLKAEKEAQKEKQK